MATSGGPDPLWLPFGRRMTRVAYIPNPAGMMPPFYPLKVWLRMVLMSEGLAGGGFAARRHARRMIEVLRVRFLRLQPGGLMPPP